jgi:lipopolysaccharide/colanic/teichoic acid biosynthesis glycosyltransferase
MHVLMRERSRVDRAGGVLSLVVFHQPGRGSRKLRYPRRLLSVLKDRLRITDEVGMIDSRRAFALLPDTDSLGAEVLARMIQKRLAGEGVFVDYAVFRYVSGRSQPVVKQIEYRDDSNDDPSSNSMNGRKGPNSHIGQQARNGRNGVERRQPAYPLMRSAHHADLDPTCMVSHFPNRLPRWKRALDLMVASSAMLIAGPAMLATALLIKLDSPGPVLFCQWRAGAGRRPFRIYKFRTMVVDAERRRTELLAQNEQDGPAFKIRNDPRITRIGRLLRATSIDELPQLLNVLKGDMTLVGPRPLPMIEAEGCESWQDARHSVHPGLTCIWQVYGRSRVSFADWARMDLRYIRKRSLMKDLRLLAATVPAVLRRDGAV